MYKFIQRKKNVLLAVFGVLLMIAFLLPIGMGQMGTDQSTIAYGHFGDQTLTIGERQRAHADLEAMRFIAPPPQPMDGRPMQPTTEFGPLMKLGEANSFAEGGRVAAMLMQSPETYALLQREAHATGIQPDPNTVEELFETYYRNSPSIKTADQAQAYRGTIERFLLVRDHYQRVLGNIKATRPQAIQQIVNIQTPTVNIVEFPAADFVAEAPVPDEDKIVSHYNKYATVTATSGFSMAATQPVQFGYRTKDRLKLQYLELPAAELIATAIRTLKPVDLVPVDSVAYAYYIANQDKFQTTPTTQQSLTLGPTTTPVAEPTTRPFADARNEIRQKVLANEVVAPTASTEDVSAAQQTRLKVESAADAIRDALRDRLLKDFNDATAAKDLARIEKVDYLEVVANDFQKSNGIRPAVKSLASDYLTAADLTRLPGIGTAEADDLPFVSVATKHAAAATAPAATQAATQATTAPTTVPSTQPTVQTTTPARPALAILEPSPLLRDLSGSTFIFRLTAFEGEHVPTLDQARPEIIRDLKLVAAFELARKKANIVRDAAGSAAANSPIGGLPVVSPPVKEVGPIDLRNNRNGFELPGYDITDPAVEQAMRIGLIRLMSMPRADQPHPSIVVDLPTKQKVVVVELRTLEKPWTADEDTRMLAQSLTGARSQFMQDPQVQDALLSWFEPKTVAERMKFKQGKE